MLPSGYTRLEYIKSSGTQWIDTGVFPDETTKIQVQLNMTEATPDVVIGNMGSDTALVEDADWRLFSANNQFYFDYGSGRVFSGTWSNNTLYELEAGNGYIKNLTTGSNIVTGSTVTSMNVTTTIRIFKGIGQNAVGNLYYLRIYEDDTIIRDFIPVKNSSGQVGLLDLVNSEFYGNDGTGSFIAGPEMTRIEYIYSSSNQYIDTRVYPTQKTRVVFDYEPVRWTDTCLFGSRTSISSTDKFLVLNEASNGYIRTDFGNEQGDTTYIPKKRTVIDKNRNVTTIDSVEVVADSGLSFNGRYSIYLNACNQAGSAYKPSYIKIYGCKIYEDNVLIRDFIPCRFSGVIGLYDLVHNEVYRNRTTSDFTAGEKYYDLNEYDRLEYIESTGTQWINTHVYPENTTRVQTNLKMKVATGDVVIGHMGHWDEQDDNADWRLFNYDNQFYLDIMSSRIYDGSWQNNVAYDIEFGNNYVKSLTDESMISEGSAVSNINTDTTIKVFNGLNNNSQGFIYYLKIYHGDNLVRDYVPVKSPDGVVGLYDLENSEFYVNYGTGSFLAGPIIILAPDPPTNLTGNVLNKILYLKWNASPTTDVTGYNIYKNGDLVGTTTSLGYMISVEPSSDHTIVVTAYSDHGESDPVSISVYYELPNPPTNLDATFDEGIIHLLWTDSTTEDVTGYRIYQNGVLVTTTPAVFSLFEFPFSNESLTENLLELSSLERVQFYQSIDPYTEYTFSVAAFNKYGESDPVSISVYYETTPDITSVSLIPNPVFTEESLTISVFVDTLYNVTIT